MLTILAVAFGALIVGTVIGATVIWCLFGSNAKATVDGVDRQMSGEHRNRQ